MQHSITTLLQNHPKPQDQHTNSPDWPPYFSWKIAWENLIKDQSLLFSLVIILLILITFLLDEILILAENWCYEKGFSPALAKNGKFQNSEQELRKSNECFYIFLLCNLSVYNADEVWVIRTKYLFLFLSFCSECWVLEFSVLKINVGHSWFWKFLITHCMFFVKTHC